MTALMPRRTALKLVAGGLLAPALPALSLAQSYPAKPVRIVVPYGPGGIADVTMRFVAEHMSRSLKQRFFIENRPGAGGVVGIQAALDAPPDGSTIMMIGGGLTIARALFKNIPYNLETDVVPISTTAFYGLVITTGANAPYKTIADLVAAAKAKPGKLNFGTINAGSAQNLSAVLFQAQGGLDVAVVPYKTTPDLASAVLRGDVDAAFEYYAGFQSPVENRQMRVLATTGMERAANLPDVPTVNETVLPGYEVTSWNGLAAKTGTPPEIIKILHDAVDDALKQADVQKFSTEAGMVARPTSSDDLHKRIVADVAKWTQLLQKVGIPQK